MNKKEIIPTSFIEGMTLEKDSWVLVDAVSSEVTKVVYYTKSQEKDDELTFREFAECYFEENFTYSIRDGAEMDFKDDIAYAAGASASEYEDYDEDSKKSWKAWTATGQVINVFKELSLENIPVEIKKAEKKLENWESEELDSGKDAAEYQKDSHAYYGVSKKDFF